MAQATQASANRILEVARRRFETFGYRRTNIAEIARDAGVAAGTIYRYFENKEDLLRQVVEQSLGEWLEEARSILGGEGTALERITRLSQASVEFNKRYGLLDAVLIRDRDIIFAPLIDELHDKLLEENVAMLAEVIRRGVEEGSLRPVDPEKAAFVLFVAGQALFGQQRVAYAESLPLFAEIAWEGLLPR
jgi:TetR/AcrR family fatty acid metabolism transcriptional regulator